MSLDVYQLARSVCMYHSVCVYLMYLAVAHEIGQVDGDGDGETHAWPVPPG